jgi:hypothetical protein
MGVLPMKVRTFGATLALTAIVAGCATPYSEAPLATNFPTTKQPKVQAASHWNTIAGDVASQITSKLTERRPLYVAQPTNKAEFDRAFANQLISALVAGGQTVLKSPAGALTVEIDTQVVRFSPDRPQYRHAGTASAITAGVWALHVGEATAGAALATTVIAADAYAWFRSEFASGATPQTEIIVTTSVSDNNQYLSRSTSIYYVADTDKSLYDAAGLQTLKVTGGE